MVRGEPGGRGPMRRLRLGAFGKGQGEWRGEGTARTSQQTLEILGAYKYGYLCSAPSRSFSLVCVGPGQPWL